MGVWGMGLYDSDTAADVRDSIRALARLPWSGEQIVNHLRQDYSGPFFEPGELDHGTFWLVLADQLAKRGIPYETAQREALHILESGADLNAYRAGSASDEDLRERARVLAELKKRLTSPALVKERRVLKKPQPYVFEVGDVIAYPTSKGRALNPYMTPSDMEQYLKAYEWVADGWGLVVIIERGREFELLAWYRMLLLPSPLPDKPTLASLTEDRVWFLEAPGTCSKLDVKRMHFERIGGLHIDPVKVERVFADRESPRGPALDNCAIAEHMVFPSTETSPVVIHGLASILASPDANG
jgi:hypothetical protein